MSTTASGTPAFQDNAEAIEVVHEGRMSDGVIQRGQLLTDTAVILGAIDI